MATNTAVTEPSDATDTYRRMLIKDARHGDDGSLDINFEASSIALVFPAHDVERFALADIGPGTLLFVKGKRGNYDAALASIAPLEDLRVATMLERLEYLFVGKRVLIKHAGNNCEDVSGNCIAVHQQPHASWVFDVELHGGQRFTFNAETITTTSAGGVLSGLAGGTRTVEVEEHVFSKDEHYMFGFDYNGGGPTEVIVARPTKVNEDDVLFHFLTQGYKSVGEYIRKDDVLAIGDYDGLYKVRGWTGLYRVLNRPLFDKLLLDGVIELG